MIKQDYLLRMIQEIISLIAHALLNKQKIPQQNWVEYDCLTQQILEVPTEKLISMLAEEIVAKYEKDLNAMGKIELAAMTLIKISDDTDNGQLVLKTRLKANGLELLKKVQAESNTFSIQRMTLIQALENNF
jgi:hypothetical protein